MELNEIAIEWVKSKVETTIIGECCSLYNSMHYVETGDWTTLKEYKKICFLLTNFNSIINPNTIVDEYFKANPDSHWKGSYAKFNTWILSAYQASISDIRDNKLDILV